MPGRYRARLTVGDWSQEVPFEILADPRATATDEDYRAQFDFLLAVRDKLSEVHSAIGNIRDLKQQLGALRVRR